MKTIVNIKIAFVILLTGVAFSCKNNEAATMTPNENDTIQNTLDTVGPEVDTIMEDTASSVQVDSVAK